MTQVFSGTPAIVSIIVADQEGKQVTYHVAGRELSEVKEAVRSSLASLPDQNDVGEPVVKKARKPRGPNKKPIAIENDGIERKDTKTEVWP